MKSRTRFVFFTGMILLSLLASLALPISALADDDTPPPPTDTAPTQPPVVDAPPTDAPAETDAPVSTDAPAVTDVPVSTDVPAATDAPVSTDVPTVTDAPVSTDTLTATDVPVATDVPTTTDVQTVLDQLPADTTIVVLDQNGDALPLASQDAAAAILSDPDPMWCPEVSGAQILPGGAGCTSYFNRFTTASGLINTLQGGSYSGPGTIYVSTGNIVAADQNKNIVLNGVSMLTLSSDNLTIQGGWDFGSNSVVNRSVFVNSTFEIKNWTGNITVNDLKFELASGISGDGLTVKNIDGNVTLNNIVITDSNSDNGVFINNVNNIEINNSKFNNNAQNGADLNADGTIALNNVIAKDNGEHGVDASADENITITDGIYQDNGKRGAYVQSYDGDIKVTGSEFINNQMSGIRAEAYDGDITLSDIYSARNDIHGANLGAAGDIKINGGSKFINNDGAGVHIMGLIGSLFVSESSVFSKNDGHGLDAEYIFGDAKIENSFFEKNKKNGLNLPDVGESINITSSDFLDNKHNGAVLDNSCGCAAGNIFISSSIFDFNGLGSGDGRGLIAHSNGDITLSDVSANANAGGGAELDNTGGSGSITLTGLNKFDDNGYGTFDIGSVGLWAVSNGDITLNGVEAMRNGLAAGTSTPIGGGGAFAGTPSGNIFISNSIFNDNCNSVYCGYFGFGFAGFGNNVTLENVTANGNGFWSDEAFGILILSYGNVLIKNSVFNGNGQLGDGSAGAVIESSGGNIDVYCSTFNDNTGTSTGYGLSVDASGTTTLNGVSFNGNTTGDFIHTGGVLVENPFDCNPSGGGGNSGSGSGGDGGSKETSSALIPVTGNPFFLLDCANPTAFTYVLPDKDRTQFNLLCGFDGVVTKQPLDGLPGPVPDQYQFVSGLNVSVLDSGKNLDPLPAGGFIVSSFKVSDPNADYTILYWNGSKWVEVPDGQLIDGFFEAKADFTGTFILVKK